MPVIMGDKDYPSDILNKLNVKVDALNALYKGYEKAVNVILLGRLSTYFDIDKQAWLDSIENCVKPQFLKMNVEAFELGRNTLDE